MFPYLQEDFAANFPKTIELCFRETCDFCKSCLNILLFFFSFFLYNLIINKVKNTALFGYSCQRLFATLPTMFSEMDANDLKNSQKGENQHDFVPNNDLFTHDEKSNKGKKYPSSRKSFTQPIAKHLKIYSYDDVHSNFSSRTHSLCRCYDIFREIILRIYSFVTQCQISRTPES